MSEYEVFASMRRALHYIAFLDAWMVRTDRYSPSLGDTIEAMPVEWWAVVALKIGKEPPGRETLSTIGEFFRERSRRYKEALDERRSRRSA